MRLCALFLLFAANQVASSTFTGHQGETWQGSRNESGIHIFKGLPFAAPPVGNLRWQPTAPYQPTGGKKSARTFASACMRADHIEDWYRDLIEKLEGDPASFEGPNGSSEDCLYLNVWTPTLNREAELPVLVWIHGGSNESGWAYEPDYRGNQLAQLNVVVISVAYRLGAFSMFALPALIAEQNGTAANYGLLDLIAALEFVHQHARAFGGNPESVTLFGESAGAENIAALLASPRAEALFHKAIHQSGSAMSSYRLGDVVQYSQSMTNDRGLAELRAMPADDFYKLQSRNKPELGFSPVAGGHGLLDNNLYQTLKA
nr:carboxylesterase family protein [Pseudomonadales bacterium]